MSETRAALVVMDFQHGVIERLGDASVVEAESLAVRAAREAGIPVFFVRVAFRPGFPEAVTSNNVAFAGVARAGEVMTQDHPATQVHSALDPRKDEPVVVKRRVSAFSGSDLAVLLRSAQVDTLVLAGITTSGVVLSTVREAADLDYRLVVLADACGDTDPEVHGLLTEKVFPHQALVTATDEWVGTL